MKEGECPHSMPVSVVRTLHTHTAADEWEIPSSPPPPPPLQQFGRKTKVENPSNGPSATEELGTVGTISIHTAKFHMHKMPFCLQ